MNLLKFIFSKTFVKQIIFAALFSGLLLGGLYIYLGVYTDHGNHVLVPDVKGISVASAGEKLAEQGLSYVVIDSVFDENAIRGAVLEQNPVADAQVKQNRDVYLTIYRKTAPSEALKVEEGMNAGVAEIILNNKGIKYNIEYESNQLLDGMVVRVEQNNESLNPDDRIRRGDAVNLVIGKSAEAKVLVPQLLGMPLDSAEKVLQNAQLSLGFPFYEGDLMSLDDTLRCRIYRQTPTSAPNKKVLVGNQVDVFLRIPEVSQTPPEMP